MPLEIETRFSFYLEEPTHVLLQFEAAETPGQRVTESDTRLPVAQNCARVAAHEGIGERIWLRLHGECDISYRASVAVERPAPDFASLPAIAAHHIPAAAVEYVFDSRYCAADRMESFVESEFSGLAGGARILAIRDWIADKIEYVPGSSTVYTTALDTFVERKGICRDFAHVLIAFARASGIPARYASCYAPEVSPQDFHAVAEVFLQDNSDDNGGAWHMVDATRMADPTKTALIGVGRDAADVSFLTSFGAARFDGSQVTVLETRVRPV